MHEFSLHWNFSILVSLKWSRAFFKVFWLVKFGDSTLRFFWGNSQPQLRLTRSVSQWRLFSGFKPLLSHLGQNVSNEWSRCCRSFDVYRRQLLNGRKRTIGHRASVARLKLQTESPKVWVLMKNVYTIGSRERERERGRMRERKRERGKQNMRWKTDHDERRYNVRTRTEREKEMRLTEGVRIWTIV